MPRFKEPSYSRVLDTIERIYAASNGSGNWTDALTGITDLLQGRAAHLLYHEHTNGEGGILSTVRTHPDALAAYEQYYHRVDPWAANPAMPKVPVGRVYAGHAFVPHSEMVKTEFYAGIGKPYSLSRMVGFRIAHPSTSHSWLSINRADQDPEFDRREMALLQRLAPHVLRALELRRMLGSALAQRDALSEALDQLEVGLVVLDSGGRPVFANREARRIAALEDGLLLEKDGVRCATPDLTGRLRDAIATASRIDHAGTPLLLPRPSARPALQLLVLQANRLSLEGMVQGTQGFLLVLRDPEQQQPFSADVLRTYFGLTPTEARFAARLAEGVDPRHIGDELRLTRSSARWTLEQVRTKLGVHTQAQAVATIWSSLARLHGGKTPPDQD